MLFFKRTSPIVITLFLAAYSIVPIHAKEKADVICRVLFQAYIVQGRKVNTADLMAASQIIASRGRHNGFWRTVLAKLKEGDEHSEIGCVRILGKMLQVDAMAREILRRYKETGEIGQWAPSVYLGPEVVAELIRRAKKADRFRSDHYAIALARARDARAKGFFLKVLENKGGGSYTSSAQFHAAVGLANLADSIGVEWLIAHSEDALSTVSNAWPAKANNNLSSCCVYALRELSGQEHLKTRAEWEAWWKMAEKPFSLKRHVLMVENTFY